MKLCSFLILLVIVFIGCATLDNQTGLAVYTALNAVDVLQTAYVFSHDEFKEKNSLLTKDTYLPVMVGSNIIIWYGMKHIDKDWRWIIWPLVGLKAGVVVNNARTGIGFEIPF